MRKSLHIIFFLTLIAFLQATVVAQVIVTTPELPTDNVSIKITFDATKGNAGLKDFTGDVYAHTGVITDKSTSNSDWKYVKTNWGVNTPETKLSKVSANIYELDISSSIRAYYGVPAAEKILKMAFVFRSADASKEGKDTGNKDIFADVYEDKFLVDLTNPSVSLVAELNSIIQVNAIATKKTSISLWLNNEVIKSLNDTVRISESITFTNPGDYWVKVTGTYNTEKSADSVFISIYSSPETATLPAGMRDGINYVDDQTATLVFYAPYKKAVHLIGDFNNWLPQNSYMMKKDGDRFWFTLTNLTPQKEYIFQYLIDGNIRVADPYAEKISDPYDDKFIPVTTYPGLIAYPADKTNERASVLQTAQIPYVWQNTTYTIPPKKDLLIYELHLRDFTTEGTLKAAKEKLVYLKDLGVNAIELMPINEFEGNDSWGYNPNFFFAPDKAYGTKNDYKDFIDACHGMGFIVIQDIVLNHSYGSSPWVRMYWDNENSQPAANNPWYNVTSPNQVFSWGYDFNHQSTFTRQCVDSVARFWMSDYKIDGFRYDFTKGFTNTPGDGGSYDAQRIENLKRMADQVWQANPDAYVILEHFAPNEEEKVLSSYEKGMLIWGNLNHSFGEASMGFHDNNKSDLSWASASSRGYSQPGLVTYMESHDEERLMYRNLTYGNNFVTYNIKFKNTALRRAGLASVFLFSIPGPKMIWQFGELGYDINIDFNGRTGRKPVKWDYYEDTARFNNVYKIYRAMLGLRKNHPVFAGGEISMSVGGPLKRINLSDNDMKVAIVGNFDVATGTVAPNFPATGTWYEYFTGKTLNVTSTTQQVTLQPGEYRLYTDKYITPLVTPGTSANNPVQKSDNGMMLYPNPAGESLFVTFKSSQNGEYEITNTAGRRIFNGYITGNTMQFDTQSLKPGVYFIRVRKGEKMEISKFLKQ
jgi:1,4-alpha-glucan branching enzyme